jgi:hypothetical protein
MKKKGYQTRHRIPSRVSYPKRVSYINIPDHFASGNKQLNGAQGDASSPTFSASRQVHEMTIISLSPTLVVMYAATKVTENRTRSKVPYSGEVH